MEEHHEVSADYPDVVKMMSAGSVVAVSVTVTVTLFFLV
jgi:hypothetical protein